MKTNVFGIKNFAQSKHINKRKVLNINITSSKAVSKIFRRINF